MRFTMPLVLGTLALLAFPSLPLSQATHDVPWAAVYTPSSIGTACATEVVAKHASGNVVFEVTSRGTCPYIPVDVCTGFGSVAGGYSASCVSGLTLRIDGTGIFSSTPSVVTYGTTWRWGFACPGPAPGCITTFGTVHWTT